jgi:hypothetical protein
MKCRRFGATCICIPGECQAGLAIPDYYYNFDLQGFESTAWLGRGGNSSDSRPEAHTDIEDEDQ